MWTEPGNKKDRERFARLLPTQRTMVRLTAEKLYDGTRTVARCWKEALDKYGA